MDFMNRGFHVEECAREWRGVLRPGNQIIESFEFGQDEDRQFISYIRLHRMYILSSPS